MSGKLYPIGIQNFEKLRRDGYYYVDKTALMSLKAGSMPCPSGTTDGKYLK